MKTQACCPRCGHDLKDLTLDVDKRLRTASGLIVLAYICPTCKRVVHWGAGNRAGITQSG